jgi:hypothetical protein
VPQRGVRGAAKFGITGFLLMFYYIGCQKLSTLSKYEVVVPPHFFKDLKGAVRKKVEKH